MYIDVCDILLNFSIISVEYKLLSIWKLLVHVSFSTWCVAISCSSVNKVSKEILPVKKLIFE